MSNTNQGIGDVTSNAKGSGARFNTGKPCVELLPISELARFYHFRSGEPELPPSPAVHALYYLGEFQEGGDLTPLFNIINILGRDGGIEESAHVFGYGAKKYAAHNWMKGMPWSVPIACAARHLITMVEQGLDAIDAESGREHRGHVLCNIWMLVLYVRTFQQGDDRPPRALFEGAAYGAYAMAPKASPQPSLPDLPKEYRDVLEAAAVVVNEAINNVPALSDAWHRRILLKDNLRRIARVEALKQ